MSKLSKPQAALACVDRGDYEQAAQLFAEAVAESATADLYNDLGYAQLTCGRIPEAEASFRQALALGPNNAQAAINLGALLACTGKLEAAVPWLQKGIASADQAHRGVVRDLLAICTKQTVSAPPAVKRRSAAVSKRK